MFVVYRKGRFQTIPYGYTTTKPYNNQGWFNAVLFFCKKTFVRYEIIVFLPRKKIGKMSNIGINNLGKVSKICVKILGKI